MIIKRCGEVDSFQNATTYAIILKSVQVGNVLALNGNETIANDKQHLSNLDQLQFLHSLEIYLEMHHFLIDRINTQMNNLKKKKKKIPTCICTHW